MRQDRVDAHHHLDLLRILAALGIVAFHFRRHLGLIGFGAVIVDRLDPLRSLVDMFFVISGFVITYFYGRMRGGGEYLRFLQRRIARLGPLHWATAALFALAGVAAAMGIVHTDHPDDYDFACLKWNLALMHAWGTCRTTSFNYVSWSISAELGMYILFPVMLWLRSVSTQLVLALGALVAGSLTVAHSATP